MDSSGNLQSYMFVYATLLARSFLILSDGRASFYSESTSCDKCVIFSPAESDTYHYAR